MNLKDKTITLTRGLVFRAALFYLVVFVGIVAIGLSGGSQTADTDGAEKISESEIFNLGDGELAIGTNTIRISRFRLDMGNLPITSLKDPVNAQDAATKSYVDAQSGGSGILPKMYNWTTSTKHYFVSASAYDGDLGGLSGADTKCNNDSNALGGKSYHALRASDTTWNATGTGLYNSTYGEQNDYSIQGIDGTSYWVCVEQPGTAGSPICFSSALANYSTGSPLMSATRASDGPVTYSSTANDWWDTTYTPNDATDCMLWSNDYSGYTGKDGDLHSGNSVGSHTLHSATPACDMTNYIMCIED